MAMGFVRREPLGGRFGLLGLGENSALIHVLGLCQAAAARLGAFEDEDIDGWVFVGVAVLGGYGAIFWTTAMSPTT